VNGELLPAAGAGVVVLCGGLLQGTVAFGFGLFSVPLLLALGFPVPTVLALSTVCTAVQSANGVHHLRHAVPWRTVGVSVAIRSGAMLFGIWVLSVLATCPISRIKFWIGLVVLVLVLLQSLWRPAPRPQLRGGWNLAAFLASGFAGGLCSMGGPPLVLWVMAHDWTTDRTRAFLFASFMCLVPLQLGALYVAFGHDVLRGMAWGAAFAPVVLLGSLLGLRLGAKFSKSLLTRLAFVLLAVIALNAMFPEVWRILRQP
jgi:uncharacterized membrane protein YfcA